MSSQSEYQFKPINSSQKYDKESMFEIVINSNNIPILFSLDLKRFEYAIKSVYHDTYNNGVNLVQFIQIEDYTNYISDQMINNPNVNILDLGKKLKIVTQYVFSRR
jgi:hypothetical protein